MITYVTSLRQRIIQNINFIVVQGHRLYLAWNVKFIMSMCSNKGKTDKIGLLSVYFLVLLSFHTL